MSFPVTYAETIGLEMEAFRECLSADRAAIRIQQDLRDALTAGLGSTPSFLINGQQIIGNEPLSVFQATIDAALAAAGE